MRLRQLLDISSPDNQSVMEELHCADLPHMQNDLSVLRVLLVPTVVQGLACPGEADGGHGLPIEPRLTEMTCQRPVRVAGRLEPDPNRKVIADACCRKALEVVQRVQDRHAATTRLLRHPDPHLVAVLGNVDGDRGEWGAVIASLRSGVVLQNHCCDLRPGYGHPLRDLAADPAGPWTGGTPLVKADAYAGTLCHGSGIDEGILMRGYSSKACGFRPGPT